MEGHGTGTRLGDPIEVQALLATYGQDRPVDRPVLLGSVKSNIGHTQAASGVAGIIKMVMAMKHGLVPRTLHVDEPSSFVDWSAGAVRLLTEEVGWPATGRSWRAGVSSFGISGTNAHVIIEQAPAFVELEEPSPAAEPSEIRVVAGDLVPWVVSGRSREAVSFQAERLVSWVRARPELTPAEVGWSLVSARALFEHRAVVTGRSIEELLEGLEAIAESAEPASVVTATTVGTEGRVAWVFSGQGSQWAGMGRGLYEAFPAFARAWDTVMELLAAQLELRPSLREVVWAEAGSADAELLDRTGYAQPALFAVQVALVELIRSWGLAPSHVLGHSVGEIAAAWSAGVFSLEDACRLVVLRAGLMQALPEGGVMVAVEAGEETVERVRSAVEGDVSIAAVNGPSSVVLAGQTGPVERVVAELGARSRKLRVSHAFHSSLMDPMLSEFGELLAAARLPWQHPRVPLISLVTGVPVMGDEVGSGEYWVRHAREAVRFAKGMEWLREQGVTRVLEIGPDTTLTALITSVDADRSGPGGSTAVGMLRKGRPESETSSRALAALIASGADVDWATTFGPVGIVPLPTYAFRRQRYWPEPAGALESPTGMVSGRRARPVPSLQERVAGATGGDRLSAAMEFVAEHVAAVLGHAGPADVATDRKFTDMGFDSLSAVELRARLGTVAGAGLPITAIFDYPTVRSMAQYLLKLLEDGAGQRGDNDSGEESWELLSDVIRHGWDAGKQAESESILRAVARIRPTFDETEIDRLDCTTSLTEREGDLDGYLVMVSPLVAMGGPHVYRRFGAALPAGLAPLGVAVPGFEKDEKLAVDRMALTKLVSASILRQTEGAPFVLTGYSSGGALAMEVADFMAECGSAPRGVVLLDTFSMKSKIKEKVPRGLLAGMRERENPLAPLNSVRLSAQIWYLDMFDGWEISGLREFPTLLIRSRDPLGDGSDDGPLPPGPMSAIRYASGDHFTIMEDYAEETADIVGAWIGTVL
ncbi:acyltransferase domain-containing protein [Amycolatopsis sp. NPDC004368]